MIMMWWPIWNGQKKSAAHNQFFNAFSSFHLCASNLTGHFVVPFFYAHLLLLSFSYFSTEEIISFRTVLVDALDLIYNISSQYRLFALAKCSMFVSNWRFACSQVSIVMHVFVCARSFHKTVCLAYGGSVVDAIRTTKQVSPICVCVCSYQRSQVWGVLVMHVCLSVLCAYKQSLYWLFVSILYFVRYLCNRSLSAFNCIRNINLIFGATAQRWEYFVWPCTGTTRRMYKYMLTYWTRP